MIFIILNAALAAYLIWASLNVNTKKKNYESRMINILLYGAIATFSMMVVLICIIYRLERIVILLEHLQIFLISAIFIESSLFFVACSEIVAFLSLFAMSLICTENSLFTFAVFFGLKLFSASISSSAVFTYFISSTNHAAPQASGFSTAVPPSCPTGRMKYFVSSIFKTSKLGQFIWFWYV